MSRRIFFVTPDETRPFGGIRVIYRHVDILHAAGIDASVLHGRRGFRCRWFENDTPVTSIGEISLDRSCIVAVPEFGGPLLHERWEWRRGGPLRRLAALRRRTSRWLDLRGVPKVIFNQNPYLTFQGYPSPTAPAECPYVHREVIATITVSEDAARYLRFAFPALPVHRVRLSIDPGIFRFERGEAGQVAFMPRKNLPHATQVINILRARGSLDGMTVTPISSASERDVAEKLGRARFFLSFGAAEGWGLPPAEAMACGALVVGYHGRGGREYFKPEYSFPVEAGDIVGFVSRVEEALALARSHPEKVNEMCDAASCFIRKNYFPEGEKQDVLRAWQAIFDTGTSL